MKKERNKGLRDRERESVCVCVCETSHFCQGGVKSLEGIVLLHPCSGSLVAGALMKYNKPMLLMPNSYSLPPPLLLLRPL